MAVPHVPPAETSALTGTEEKITGGLRVLPASPGKGDDKRDAALTTE